MYNKSKFYFFSNLRFLGVCLFVCLFVFRQKLSLYIDQGRNEVYEIRDQGPKKGLDPGSQPRVLGSQPPGSGSAVFSLDRGSAVLDQQNFAG